MILIKQTIGIGIVPFIYKEANDYFYRIYLAKISNLEIINKPIKVEVEEIEIGSPRAKINSPKLFIFGEDKEKE